MAKFRFNKPSNKAAQNDRALKLFGNGADGNVVISTNQTISRDMYYNDLTVNNGITLFTNGFKIFVKGTLANSGTVGMPSGTSQTTSVLAGSVMTRDDGTAGYDSADAVDGTIASIASIDDYDSLIYGVRQTGMQVKRWYPGTKGTAGSDGTDGTDGTANPGNAGSGGGSSSGNAGTAGLKGAKGTGGSFGQAGGSVVIVANNITGSGTFVSEGTTGTSGTSGSSGNAGASGNAGTTVAGNSNYNPATGNYHDTGTGANANYYDAGTGANANYVDSGSGAHANHGGGIYWYTPASNHPFSNPNHQHPHTVPGNPYHNPGAHYGGAQNPAHHRPTNPKSHTAAHTRPSSHVAGNAAHHPGHPTHKGHSHTKHVAASDGHNPNHITGHNANTHNVSGHNPNSHPVGGHNANTHNLTGHTPGNVAGTNPSFPGGTGGTANSGNPGNPGASGNPGAPGTLVVFTRNISTHIANSNVTIIKDVDS